MGKAPGPSGIVVEMIRAAGDMSASMISQLLSFAMARYPLTGSRVSLSVSTREKGMHWKGATSTVSSWQNRSWKSWRGLWTASDSWCQTIISSLALSQAETQQTHSLLSGSFKRSIYQAIRLYMAFVDLEKAFDRVLRKVIWWALRKLGVEEWIVRLVQGMYANAPSHVRVGEGYSEEFEVKVGVHQGSVLIPLLFIIVLEALSWEFCSGVPWEELYAYDLVIFAESLKEYVRRLLTWKEAMEKKGLRVNAGKLKIMICGTGLDLLQSSCEFPCTICRTGVGSNSIFCNGCKHWVHKKCSGLKRLTNDPDYRFTRCQGTARLLDSRPQRDVQVGPDKLEVVASFCYLGDMLSAAGGCEFSTTTCVKTARKKFKVLLPVISSRHLSFKTRGHVYSSCVRSVMLHASET